MIALIGRLRPHRSHTGSTFAPHVPNMILFFMGPDGADTGFILVPLGLMHAPGAGPRRSQIGAPYVAHMRLNLGQSGTPIGTPCG